MSTSTLSSQINGIMDRFDFEKVLKVMHFLNWRWNGKDLTVGDLKSNALYLFDCVITGYEESEHKEYGFSCATGGFVAEVITFSNADPRLQLTFYVDQTAHLAF